MSNGLEAVADQGPPSWLTHFPGGLASTLDLLMDRHVSPRQEFGRQPTQQAIEFLLDVAARVCYSVVPYHFILRFSGHLPGFFTPAVEANLPSYAVCG
jgi:hypothetical protein